jgi:hypothetical protein
MILRAGKISEKVKEKRYCKQNKRQEKTIKLLNKK